MLSLCGLTDFGRTGRSRDGTTHLKDILSRLDCLYTVPHTHSRLTIIYGPLRLSIVHFHVNNHVTESSGCVRRNDLCVIWWILHQILLIEIFVAFLHSFLFLLTMNHKKTHRWKMLTGNQLRYRNLIFVLCLRYLWNFHPLGNSSINMTCMNSYTKTRDLIGMHKY